MIEMDEMIKRDKLFLHVYVCIRLISYDGGEGGFFFFIRSIDSMLEQ